MTIGAQRAKARMPRLRRENQPGKIRYKNQMQSNSNQVDHGARMKLSVRESQILELLKRGLTNKQLGQKLGISPNTARDYISGMLRRYHIETRTALVALHTRERAPRLDHPITERRATPGDRRLTSTADPVHG